VREQSEEDPIETTFELNDTLYAKAEVPPTEEVYLWLGANVMLAYPIDEAEELLEGKLKAAKTSLANCEEDLDFLREQVTVRVFSCPLQVMLRGRALTNGRDDCRLWRLLSLGCITGTWCRRGRIRRRRRRRERRG
jgi:hypothetical protein